MTQVYVGVWREGPDYYMQLEGTDRHEKCKSTMEVAKRIKHLQRTYPDLKIKWLEKAPS